MVQLQVSDYFNRLLNYVGRKETNLGRTPKEFRDYLNTTTNYYNMVTEIVSKMSLKCNSRQMTTENLLYRMNLSLSRLDLTAKTGLSYIAVKSYNKKTMVFFYGATGAVIFITNCYETKNYLCEDLPLFSVYNPEIRCSLDFMVLYFEKTKMIFKNSIAIRITEEDVNGNGYFGALLKKQNEAIDYAKGLWYKKDKSHLRVNLYIFNNYASYQRTLLSANVFEDLSMSSYFFQKVWIKIRIVVEENDENNN